jgi:hypothetical protein
VSIAVEDWDDLTSARRRRDERAGATPPAPAAATGAAPALEPEPEPDVLLGVANFADDSYGDTFEDIRVPAGVAGANVLIWLAGLLTGVVELVGVAFFVSVGLLLAAYITREWQKDRTALLCLAGALPLPITIIGLFT